MRRKRNENFEIKISTVSTVRWPNRKSRREHVSQSYISTLSDPIRSFLIKKKKKHHSSFVKFAWLSFKILSSRSRWRQQRNRGVFPVGKNVRARQLMEFSNRSSAEIFSIWLKVNGGKRERVLSRAPPGIGSDKFKLKMTKCPGCPADTPRRDQSRRGTYDAGINVRLSNETKIISIVRIKAKNVLFFLFFVWTSILTNH